MNFPNTLIEKATDKKDIRQFANNPYLDVEHKRLISLRAQYGAIQE